MNHLIRKDLRALRWGLFLWTAACFTHLGLRLAQHARGDTAELTPFWRRLETTDRWDHLAVIALPVLLIPVLLHLDPLRGALAFWKSVPISRRRLLAAKFATLLAFFVALPLACEVIYFWQAGLAVVLAPALADWAWRWLPGIAAVVLGCLFTRSLKVGVPGVALALWLAVWIFHWPYGSDRLENPIVGAAPAPPASAIAPPPGARIEIEPKTLGFQRTVYQQQSPSQRKERLAVALRVHASGLPADVLVRGVRLHVDAIHLPGRKVSAASAVGNPFGLTGSSELPAQEQRDDFGRPDVGSLVTGPNQWSAVTEQLDFGAKDVAPAGAFVEGTVSVALSRKRVVAELPLAEGAAWQPGLHRFTLSNVADANALETKFRGTLATVLADPRGATGGLDLTPRTSFYLWLEHTALPYRKYLQLISSDKWRSNRPAPFSLKPLSDLLQPPSAGLIDITRSRRRTVIAPLFDPVAALRQGATPLQVARFSEEQAQVRNWRLVIVTYEDLGTVELPLKAVVLRPPIASQEDEKDELKPPGPSLGTLLTEVVVPPNPTREDAQRILSRLAEIASQRSEDSIRRHENALLQKLAALGADNVEVLLTALANASPPPLRYENQPRYRSAWLLERTEANPFWRRVRYVACDLARPINQALFLRYHSPRVDLLRAIEPHGWEVAALPAMCVMAEEEAAPEAWHKVFARHPGQATQSALLAQIRLRAVSPWQAAELIASGALPGREAASAVWETALANTGNIEALTPAFPLALKHGVEVIPRDLVRILRLTPEDWTGHSGAPFKTRQSAFVQSFALRSECPPTLADAAPWLEQNALVVQFNEATRRYELPGAKTLPGSLGKWGDLIEPIGAGQAAAVGDTLVLTAGGTIADYWSDNNRRTAPHVMREITGDFTAEVTVRPVFDLAPAWDRGNPYAIFQSAGILVDAGVERWLRWEHALSKTNDGHELREECFRAGKNIVSQRATGQWDRTKALRLRVARHGDYFGTAWRQEGGGWVESPAIRNDGWPKTVRIGPLAVNAVTRLMSVEFSDFRIETTSVEPAKTEPPREPHPFGAATPSGTEIPGWGTVENPIGAGVVTAADGALTIDVAPRYADYHIQQSMTAPRVLREVEGDFTFEVTLAPTPRLAWSSAEMLLTAGADFYLRIGVAFYEDKPYFTQEFAEHGRPVGMLNLAAQRDLTKPLRLRLQRRGWFLTIAHQQEGGAWTEFYPLNLRAWPAKPQVGVAALNTSKEPFTARFSDLKFTRD